MKRTYFSLILTALFVMANMAIADATIKPDTLGSPDKQEQFYSLIRSLFDEDMLIYEVKSSPEKGILPEASPVPVEKNLTYLKFDVNQFISESDPEAMELPLLELDYLCFDVNKFMEGNPVNMEEMPGDTYSYLRFDVQDYTRDCSSGYGLGELPEAE